MNGAAQIEAEWGALGSSGVDAATNPADGDGRGAGAKAYPSDEEILEIPPSLEGGYGGQGLRNSDGHEGAASGKDSVEAAGSREIPRRDGLTELADHLGAAMPEWLRVSAGDPRHAAEVEQLWREHQEFRGAFASVEEARAIKELFPGGATEARALRESTLELRQSAQAIDQFDAAIFSGDPRAQSELVAELARTNPVAFRSLFAEAARVLGDIGGVQAPGVGTGPTLRESREGFGTGDTSRNISSNISPNISSNISPNALPNTSPNTSPNASWDTSRDRSELNAAGLNRVGLDSLRTPDPHFAHGAKDGAPAQTTGGPIAAQATPQFDAGAYASFERATNDAVGRDVRASVRETLSRVLPEGIAEGAARRIGEDIFNEIHRTLASDRALSEQVGDVLRGWRFGAAEQQRVAGLLAGRAKQLVPVVTRRVIGEWTGSVLGTARSRDARRAAAASRVDIAAPGGSRDSMPLRPMSAREIHYASMSDEDILGM